MHRVLRSHRGVRGDMETLRRRIRSGRAAAWVELRGGTATAVPSASAGSAVAPSQAGSVDHRLGSTTSFGDVFARPDLSWGVLDEPLPEFDDAVREGVHGGDPSARGAELFAEHARHGCETIRPARPHRHHRVSLDVGLTPVEEMAWALRRRRFDWITLRIGRREWRGGTRRGLAPGRWVAGRHRTTRDGGLPGRARGGGGT